VLSVVCAFVERATTTQEEDEARAIPPTRLRIADIGRMFVIAAQSWSKDNASRLAASFSFYAILSLAPLLVLAVAVASNFLDAGEARQSLLKGAGQAIGSGAKDYIATLIEGANKPGAGTIASILSVLLALYGASNLFAQLADAVNAIWGIRTGGHPFRNFIIGKLFSVLMVLVFAFLVVGWLIVDAVLTWLADNTGAFAGWPAVSFGVSVLFLTFVFALAFKALPRDMVAWRDVWLGAVTTAVGFGIAKSLLSMYFRFSHAGSVYGSAGALVVILLWFYYTAQIFFFGAELTCTYAHEFGSHRGEPPGDLEYS
jgi:membrane protein